MAKDEFVSSVQAWTFNRFTAFEAVDKVAQAGGRFIEFYPGQKMQPGSEVGVGPQMGEAATTALLSHCKSRGVVPVAFGVTDVPSEEAGARRLFEWVRSMGILVVNTESTGSIDTIEKMVREFDVKVGFHNHPRRVNDPNYKVWNPAYVYSLVAKRDKRIGACADTGHWVRSGIKPVDAIRTLKGRVVSSHLKDLTEFDPGAHDVPFGTGVSEIAQILSSYRSIGFYGPASVEYEHKWDDNLSDVASCLGFVRGYYSGK